MTFDIARSHYKNIRVRAFVVRSLLTGETQVRWEDDLRFWQPGVPRPSLTKALEADDAHSLLDAGQFVMDYCGKKEIKIKKIRINSGRFRRLLADAIRELEPDAWAMFDGSDEVDLGWHPVAFVSFDWTNLSALDVFAQAGEKLSMQPYGHGPI